MTLDFLLERTATPLLRIEPSEPGAEPSAVLAARREVCGRGSMTTRTTLHDACMHGQLVIAQRLHSAGASLDATDTNGTTPLHEACGQGHLYVGQWLYSAGASLDATDTEGRTPLHAACYGGFLDIAQWLHSAGASLDATDSARETPLHLACSKGHLDVAQWLYSAGASLDATDNEGWALLHEACYRGFLDIAWWLHRAGASLNATDKHGRTPLHLACEFGELETAVWLCSARADATLKTDDGDTPAQLLVSCSDENDLDEQRLRSTLACLVRRAQAQGPMPCPAARMQAVKTDAARHALMQVQRCRTLRGRQQPHPARTQAQARTCGYSRLWRRVIWRQRRQLWRTGRA